MLCTWSGPDRTSDLRLWTVTLVSRGSAAVHMHVESMAYRKPGPSDITYVINLVYRKMCIKRTQF
jgi:hypothetical protein